mgnify:FL=1
MKFEEKVQRTLNVQSSKATSFIMKRKRRASLNSTMKLRKRTLLCHPSTNYPTKFIYINHTILASWNRSLALRFIQAHGFKISPSITAVQQYAEWAKTKLPMQLTPKIEEYLVNLREFSLTIMANSKKELCILLDEIIGSDLFLY